MTSAMHRLPAGAKRTTAVPALAAIAVAAVLAGCGSSHSSSSPSASTPTATKTTTSPSATRGANQATAQITRDWTTFFAASTPVSKRVSLLQNGQRFGQAIAAQSKSPLAQQAQAKVSKVTVTGPDRARVTYTVLLAGKPALSNQTGTAVKSGGVWRVSDTSFCQLLALEGGAPAACPKG